MNKQIYLIRGDEKISHHEFGGEMSRLAKSLAQNKTVERLSYVATIEPPPGLSIIPFKKGRVATVSVWTKEDKPVKEITEIAGLDGAYAVTEALPVAYEKTWKDGEQTPGVCLLTLFQKKKGIDRETFLDRWHNSHTPMSLRVHPLWHYDRNVVEKKLTGRSASWDGIVQEHMRTRAELMNPFRFFGPPHLILQRMIGVYRDTNSFLDYKTVEPYLVAEYWVRG